MNEDEVLKKFRERVRDIVRPEHDDHFLCRWLRARAYDIDKAEDMFRKNQEWRRKWRMDQVLLQEYKPPEVLAKYFPGGLSGYDKEGAPVWITPSGYLDITGLTRSCRRQEIIMYNMYLVEHMHKLLQEQTNKLGRTVDQVVLIDDLDNFSLSLLFSQGMDVILKMLSVVEANYPEALKHCYIINAPRYWNLIYSMVKPFLSENTKKKIVILSYDWKEKLLEIIDADQLPEHWGGTQRDPDGNPKCPSKICLGGEVPRRYYQSIEQCVDPSRLTGVTVAAGTKLDLPIVVTENNTVIRWVFQTVNCDIGFSVTRQGEDGALEEVVPWRRVNSHVVFADGTYECQRTGTYLVHFDNAYSWMTSKEISYVLEVMKPSEQIKRAEQAKEESKYDDDFSSDL